MPKPAPSCLLNGKVVLVVGGTSGIGRATAIALAAAGAKVLVGGRREAEGAETARLAAEAGGEARFQAMDAAIDAHEAAMVDAALSAWGRIDGAFNNAGVEGRMAPLHEQSEDDFDQLIAINQKSCFLGMRRQIAAMLKSGGGAIVNTASIGGVVGFPNTGIYCGTKHAIIGMSKTAALEVGKSNIRVNCIAPGATRSRLLSAMSGGDDQAEAAASVIPIGRVADPSEIASAVCFLLSDAASYVTGTVLLSDGGLTAA